MTRKKKKNEKKNLILDLIDDMIDTMEQERYSSDTQINRDIVNDLERLSALVRGVKNWEESFTDFERY